MGYTIYEGGSDRRHIEAVMVGLPFKLKFINFHNFIQKTYLICEVSFDSDKELVYIFDEFVRDSTEEMIFM